MKHIINYKMFESNDDSSYRIISTSEIFPEEFGDDEINDRKISKTTEEKIIDSFPELEVGEFNPNYIHRLNCTTFIDYKNKFDFDISEVDDEWFYVSFHPSNGEYRYYKCDQIEGVFNLIRYIYKTLL